MLNLVNLRVSFPQSTTVKKNKKKKNDVYPTLIVYVRVSILIISDYY